MYTNIPSAFTLSADQQDGREYVRLGYFPITRESVKGESKAHVASATYPLCQMRRPFGVAVHPTTGDVYVTDKDQHCIRVFDKDLVFKFTSGSRGAAEGQFDNPRGISVSQQGVVAVVEFFNHRVQLFTSDMVHMLTFGGKGKKYGAFDSPSGVTFDADGNIYVTDEDNHRIQKFDSQGQYILTFGEKGSPGECRSPFGIVVSSASHVLVLPRGAERIYRYALDGSFIDTIDIKRLAGNWNFISRGPHDGFVIGDYQSETITIYDGKGKLLEHLENTPACGVAFGPDQSFYFVNTKGNTVSKR
eukprot:TRINITY_DN6489_c0_g1_i1.p1 TRINITY_DN6489_c0_g1~~TRINITY_DN6489_c0_g1_i1.p1  ORF type:complete len:303 (-),score=52.29 TRINITY_DN6489_c0_g1_i1:985-1893(-)